MLVASVVVLMLNSRAAMFEPTPIGYFKAAISEKDVERKCELIESGLGTLRRLRDADEKNRDEVNRLFTLYLGFLAADLPFETVACLASTASYLLLPMELNVLALEAFDGYLVKLRASKEDVPDPPPPHGGFTGHGNLQLKPSEILDRGFLVSIRNHIQFECMFKCVQQGGPHVTFSPWLWR